MKPSYDFYTEETTKGAADAVLDMQSCLVKLRESTHPISGEGARALRVLESAVNSAKDMAKVAFLSGAIMLLGKMWAAGGAALAISCGIYIFYRYLQVGQQKCAAKVTEYADVYYNAAISEQLLAAAAAASLRLSTYDSGTVLFIDKDGKEWKRYELLRQLNRTQGTETALQFLLSCAVFGWPAEGMPLRELTADLLRKLRSMSVINAQNELLN